MAIHKKELKRYAMRTPKARQKNGGGEGGQARLRVASCEDDDTSHFSLLSTIHSHDFPQPPPPAFSSSCSSWGKHSGMAVRQGRKGCLG